MRHLILILTITLLTNCNEKANTNTSVELASAPVESGSPILNNTELYGTEDEVDTIQECRKTLLFTNLNEREVVIYVESFNPKTGEVLKQQFLKGKGKVPQEISSVLPLMNNKKNTIKKDQYIYAYDHKQPNRSTTKSNLMLLYKSKVKSKNESIDINILIKTFKQLAKKK